MIYWYLEENLDSTNKKIKESAPKNFTDSMLHKKSGFLCQVWHHQNKEEILVFVALDQST